MESTGILLHHEDSTIRVDVNGVEKFLAKEWLTGDGRAANTILSKQILGTEEGLQGTSTLTLNEELFPFFDLVVDWLSNGDDHTRPILSNQNTLQLNDLALYFGLEGLLNAIQQERQQRLQKIASLEQRARDAEGVAAGLEGGAAGVEGRVERLEGRAERLEGEAEGLEGRAASLESTVASVEAVVADFDEVADLKERCREAAQRARQGAQRWRENAQRARESAQRAREPAQRWRETAQQIRGNFPFESIPTQDHSSV